MRLFSFYSQTTDESETHSLVQATETFNQTPRQAVVWGSGGIAARIVNLDTTWR
jgi:hypothetical protein